MKEKECRPATQSCKNKIGLAQLLLTSRHVPATFPPHSQVLPAHVMYTADIEKNAHPRLGTSTSAG